MATRFTAGDGKGVSSGYEGANSPPDIKIPPVGIRDLDRALFNCFNQELGFVVANKEGSEAKKVPVIFAGGERFAMIKNNRGIRDSEGTIILPLITIYRRSIQQTVDRDITGRGINQQTGELVVKRRLSVRDRTYQNLINKLGLVNQDTTLSTERPSAEFANEPGVLDGALLSPRIKNNVWEIITVPSPQFFSATYEVTFWTQHLTHMNQLKEKLISSYLPQGNALRLETDKGYWFLAMVDDNQFSSEDNTEDSTEEERIIKVKFTLTCFGYILVSNAPGMPVPVRRFVSAPFVTFSLEGATQERLSQTEAPNLPNNPDGTDDPTMGFSLNGSVTRRQNPEKTIGIEQIVTNPFTGKKQPRYARIVSRNARSGETVLKEDDTLILKIVDR